MAIHWALRWFAMLIIFSLSTVAFSSYASADSPPDDPPDSTDVSSSSGDAETDGDADGQTNADGETDPESGVASAEHRQSQAVHRYDPATTNYMVTITRSAFMGALLGAMVGGSFYLISRFDISPWTIAYFTAGGVFFGATMGLVEISIRESRIERQMRRDELAQQLGASVVDRAKEQIAAPMRLRLPLVQFSF